MFISPAVLGLIYIGMFISLFWRFKNIEFLLPIAVLIHIFTAGFQFNIATLLVVCFCTGLAAFAIIFQINRFLLSRCDADDEESADSDEIEASHSKRPTRQSIKEYKGKLLAFGMDNWKHDRSNDMSFFVELPGNKVWAIGLKDAVERSGAKIGDRVVFWKESEVRTSNAQVLDRNGKVTGYRALDKDKRRGIWIMEVVN